MTDKTIWKQELAMQDSQIIYLPNKAQILSAQVQHGKLCIWFMFILKYSMEPKPREICIYGTGHDIIKDNLEHISTVMIHEGQLVFHVFEAL